jgi:hypothetical protein
MGRKSTPICIDDLLVGRRVRISERELSQLDGRSIYTHQRNRYLGKGIPFQKDDQGRVWYLAEDVLADLQRKRHRSTSEYDTSSQIKRLSKARSALSRTAVTKAKTRRAN